MGSAPPHRCGAARCAPATVATRGCVAAGGAGRRHRRRRRRRAVCLRRQRAGQPGPGTGCVRGAAADTGTARRAVAADAPAGAARPAGPDRRPHARRAGHCAAATPGRRRRERRVATRLARGTSAGGSRLRALAGVLPVAVRGPGIQHRRCGHGCCHDHLQRSGVRLEHHAGCRRGGRAGSDAPAVTAVWMVAAGCGAGPDTDRRITVQSRRRHPRPAGGRDRPLVAVRAGLHDHLGRAAARGAAGAGALAAVACHAYPAAAGSARHRPARPHGHAGAGAAAGGHRARPPAGCGSGTRGRRAGRIAQGDRGDLVRSDDAR